jgi:hypothetical protein
VGEAVDRKAAAIAFQKAQMIENTRAAIAGKGPHMRHDDVPVFLGTLSHAVKFGSLLQQIGISHPQSPMFILPAA